ncbi:hypothetical protein [Pseudoclavibacter soli]|uniref:hypothetical protein n=1 Tax=Pseudoclavibacter soli TaxID=452623 RepID=UPI0012EB20C1|nr:hypothetical protein [Pseudoclavibacter soli]
MSRDDVQTAVDLSTTSKVPEANHSRSVLLRAVDRAPFVLIGAAALGIVSLFLPVVSIGQTSMNSFSTVTNGDGFELLGLMLILIAGGCLVLLYERRWTHIAVGSASLVVAIIGMVDGVGSISRLSRYGAPVGGGLVVLGVASGIMAIAAV